MLGELAFIVLSLLLLFAGAEALVRGSSSIALRAGLSPLVIGLTIVAFGTSSPELVVSIKSALAGQGDIAIGNVVGSNSFNIAIILGLTALVCPIPVHRQIIRMDAPIALGVALLLVVLLVDQFVGRVEGLALILGLAVYTVGNVVLARRQNPLVGAPPVEEVIPSESRHWSLDLGMIVVGLGVLVLGSRLLVDNAVSLATTLGMSEAIIGLTIVAAGTSMPELATSLVAAFRGQSDIAVGNIVGSNVFNVLGIVGVAATIAPLNAPGISMIDYGAMLAFTVLVIPLLYTSRTLHRAEGALLLALYGVYLWMIWPA